MKKIFIVEDVAVNRMMLETILTQHNFEIVGTAVTAKDALAKIETTKPDLVLLDIQLHGDKTGIWIGQQLNEKFKIPFIYITAYQDPYTTEEVLKTQPFGFIVKPINTAQLITTINIALNIHREHSDNLIKIVDGKRTLQINPAEVLYLQSDGNYVHIYTKNNHLLVRNTLQHLIDVFPVDFLLRIHLRTAINPKWEYSFNGTEISIQGKTLNVSNTYKSGVLERLKK